MFKTVAIFSLCYMAVFSLQMEKQEHQAWTIVDKLDTDQAEWDTFFRGRIKAIGNAKAAEADKKAGGEIAIRYINTDAKPGETVAWEVQGNADKANKLINRVVQTKRAVVSSTDPNTSSSITATYIRKGLEDVTKEKLK